MKNQYGYQNKLKIKAIEMHIGLGIPKYKVAQKIGVSYNSVEAWIKLYKGDPILAMKVRQSKINTPEIVGGKTK